MRRHDTPLLDPRDEASMRHWAEKLAVTPGLLREAVAQVGADPQRVGAWLLRRRSDDHAVRRRR
ncbi:DUF3606 domain-containing protein [Caldimonas thermodepolymerans]|nr:DUF3606 domain-containing protein [Caldimonas thermodepolymerans]UZG44864.1 DUF3606 domain-containing protein [Caldimonas thermodepolymerans]